MVKLTDTVTPPISEISSDKPLADLVAQLRNKGSANSAIVDLLVTAYCPEVAAATSMTEAQKEEEVSRFAAKVTGLVYARPGSKVEDVLIDVPLPPSMVEQIHTASKHAGVTTDAWIKQVIGNALH